MCGQHLDVLTEKMCGNLVIPLNEYDVSSFPGPTTAVLEPFQPKIT